ncbi:MAG: hypothetical protein ACRD6W_12905 [Nitrososphaerales archaeon]
MMRYRTLFTRSLVGVVAGAMLVTLVATPGLAARKPKPIKTTPAATVTARGGLLPALPGMSSALKTNVATLNSAAAAPALTPQQTAFCAFLLAVRLQIIAYFSAHPNPFLGLLFLLFIDFELTHNGCTVPSGNL